MPGLTAEIILIHKPGKDPTKVDSYRPISLFPIIARLLEKLLMQGIKNDPASIRPFKCLDCRGSESY
jgi:hypothetical protein